MEAKPMKRGFTAEDILRPEILLGIAAILVLIAGIGLRSITVVIIALIMSGSAVISWGLIASPLLGRTFSVLSVSVICGVILFFFSIDAITAPGKTHWSIWVILIGSLISLFAAFMGFTRARPGFGRGAG